MLLLWQMLLLQLLPAVAAIDDASPAAVASVLLLLLGLLVLQLLLQPVRPSLSIVILQGQPCRVDYLELYASVFRSAG